MSQKLSGSCLCGAVRLSLQDFDGKIGVCHCKTCQTWTGGPALAISAPTPLVIEGEEAIRYFASSDWAERAFCSTCGTHLFARLKETGASFVRPGLFGALPEATLAQQIYIDHKPAWYDFANRTLKLTAEQVQSLWKKL